MSIKITIYGKEDCPWTLKSKDWFEAKGITKFKLFDVTKDLNARDEMFKMTGNYTYPVIVIDGNVINGFDMHKIEKSMFM